MILGTPVAHATIEVAGLSGTTDGNGYYFIEGITPGTHPVVCRHPDYYEVRDVVVIEPDKTTRHDFRPINRILVALGIGVVSFGIIGGITYEVYRRVR